MNSIKGKLTRDFWKHIESQLNGAVPLDGSWEIEVKKYKRDRSSAQRRLQHVWYTYILNADEKQHSKDYIERFCKCRFGVPILVRDNEKFDESWSKMAMYMTYEQRIASMAFLPVTRLFTVSQNAEYLDEMYRYYSTRKNPIFLPNSDDLYYDAMGYKR